MDSIQSNNSNQPSDVGNIINLVSSDDMKIDKHDDRKKLEKSRERIGYLLTCLKKYPFSILETYKSLDEKKVPQVIVAKSMINKGYTPLLFKLYCQVVDKKAFLDPKNPKIEIITSFCEKQLNLGN